MNKRKALVHIKSLMKARGLETPAPQKDKKPALDPVEALHHIKTLSRAAQDSIDMAIVQQHLKMIQAIVEKALPMRK
jgi:hypothetical protein